MNQKSGGISAFASRILGKRGRASFIGMHARVVHRGEMLEFPHDLNSARRLLCVLPGSTFESLYQVNTVLSLVSSFRDTQVTLFCEENSASLFLHISGIEDIVTYRSSDRYLFSRAFRDIARTLRRREFDLCILLDRKPDASVLHMVSRVAAKIRAGYEGVARFPLLNVRIKPSQTRVHVAEQNILMAEILGAKRKGGLRWSVSKETGAEITHMIREYSVLGNSTSLIGVDAECFFHQFGPEWTDALLEKLTGLGSHAVYLFAERAPEGAFLEYVRDKHLPVFSGLSLSRSAALISKSTLMITGKAIAFELAHLLGKTAVGVFEESEIGRYCRSGSKATGIAYSEVPDSDTIQEIRNMVLDL